MDAAGVPNLAQPLLIGTLTINPLIQSIKFNNEEELRELLARGVDPNEFVGGITPLHVAAGSGNAHFITLLLRHGANPNLGMLNDPGETPAHFACRLDQVECVELLLNAGANINIENKSFQTPLVASIISGAVNSMKLFLERGADITSRHKQTGLTTIHFAAATGQSKCLEVLIEKGISITETNKEGLTALHLAAVNGKRECLQMLLKRGLSDNVLDIAGSLAIHGAAYNGHVDCIAQLLDINPLYVDVRNNEGLTPLMMAADRVHLNAIKFLIQKNADINSHSYEEKSVLYYCARRAHFACVRYLLECDALL